MLEAADEVSATAIARLEGRPVEVVGDRTATDTVYAMPDGSMVLARAMGPVRVLTGGDGSEAADWARVDLTLAAGEDGLVRPGAHAAGLELAGKSQVGADGVVLAAITDPVSGERTAVRWLGGDLPAPELSGRRATYREVQPGVDLVVEATATGFEDYLVLNKRPAPGAKLSFPLAVESDAGTVSAAKDGSLSVVAADGRTVASGPAPMMWDAAADLARDFPVSRPRSAEPTDVPAFAPLSADLLAAHGVNAEAVRAAREADEPIKAPGLSAGRPAFGAGREAAVAVTREQRGRSTRLGLVPDRAFLQDPKTTYPVVVDPAVSSLGATFDTYVIKGYSDDRSGQTRLDLGTYDGGVHIARAFFTFSTGIFADAAVTSATLNLAEYHSWSCSARQWDVWATDAASTSSTWTNQPYWSTLWATSTQTTGYSGSCPAGWVSADVKDLAQAWATNGSTTAAVGLRAHSETDNYGWKRFYSSEYGAGYAPTLIVAYNRRPNIAGKPTVSPGTTVSGTAWTSTLQPTLSSLVSDPEPTDTIHAAFEVWTGAPDTGTLIDRGDAYGVASGSVAQHQVPAGKLQVGVQYFARVAVSDGTIWAGVWSPVTTFQIDVSAPAAPEVSSTDFPADGTWHGDPGQAGTFTIDPPVDDSLVAYQWSLDRAPDPNQTVAASTTGAPSTLPVTPATAGKHVLQLQAVDRGGSTSAVVKYAFQVGKAGIVTPEDGAQVVSRVRLEVTGDPQYDFVRFQWRRGEGAPTTADVPLTDLATSWGMGWQALATNGWAPLPVGAAQYTVWNAATTMGGIPGPVQVRAQVATDSDGTGAVDTGWVSLVVDPDATGAASAGIGPGAVNLLNGDYTLAGTDAEEFGVSIVRTASSRDVHAGGQTQTERLTAAQSEATSAATFNANLVTLGISSSVSHAGGTSLSLTPTAGSANTTYACVGGCSGAFRLGMAAGRTYRVSGWIYVPAASGLNAPYMYGESMMVYAHRSSGGYVQGQSNQATVTDSWQRLELELTIPTDATDAYLVLYNGFAQGSGKAVYYDDLSVREVSYPFGPQWAAGAVDALSGSAYTMITRPADGVVGVGLVGGGDIWFTSGDDVHWWPQPGAEDLSLSYNAAAGSFRLTELDGTTTDFVKDTTSGNYPVSVSAPPGGQVAARQVFTQSSGVSRLTRIIAPIEDGVDNWPTNGQACNPAGTAAPATGCEVLDLTYATATTATASQPGDVAGRVKSISAWSWDPATATVTKVVVAAYAYDPAGQLVAVWDPRLETAGANRQATTYTYDSSGRVASVTAPGELPYTFTYGPGGAPATGSGDWIDPSPGRLLSVSRASLVPGTTNQVGPTNTTTVVYGVPLTRTAGGPYDLGADALATWVQTDGPTDATAVFGPQDPPGVSTATETVPGPDGYDPATVHYLNASGWEVNTASPAGPDAPAEGFIETAEYDRSGNVVRALDATNRLLALRAAPDAQAQLTVWGLGAKTGTELAQLLDSRSTYSLDGLDLLTQIGPVQQLAVANDPNDQRLLRGRTTYSYDQAKPDGAAYHLVTTTVTDGLDPASGLGVDPVTTITGYAPVDGASALGATSGWVHKQPTTVTVAYGTSLATTATTVYDTRGRPVRSSKPGSTGTDAATTVSVLYTAGANATYPQCGSKPQWAGQACRTSAAGAVTGHDTTRAASQLPVKEVTAYNRWGSPTTITESATGPVGGSTVTMTRTATTTYDAADRVTTVSITGTGTGVGQQVATTRTVYDPANGDVTAIQQLAADGTTVTSSVVKAYDVLGRLVSYTDGTGQVTTSTYDRYGQVTTTTQVIAGVSTTTTYTYDRAIDPRGYVTSFTDSVAGTITATWGPDGQLTSEQLPGGITLSIGYDPARVPVARVYTRDSDGQELWHDSVVENHRGQWVIHTATTGIATYTYDGLGRLTGAADTLDAGQGLCTARGYTYDAHSNRTAAATAVATTPGVEHCLDPATGTGPVTSAYDSADRLVSTSADAGATWAYDPLGRTTSMPDGDGGQVVNEFYVNDLIAAQTITAQQKYTWALDPIQRRSTNTQYDWLAGAWQESATKASHYASDSDEPSWISEDVTNPTDVTRYVSGVEGDLAVTTTTTGDRVVQLVDLHGDVVATIPIADNAAQATWTSLVFQRSDEFGNLNSSLAGKRPPAHQPGTGGSAPLNAPPKPSVASC